MEAIGRIRKFGYRYISVRNPTQDDIAAMSDKIRVDERTWVDRDLGVDAFARYKHLFDARCAYMISNRQHYEGHKPDDVTKVDITHPWPIFTVNYSVECVMGMDIPNTVFSFWQDRIPRSKMPAKVVRVYGTLIQDVEKDPAIPVLRVSALAFGCLGTPKTIILMLKVMHQLGVKMIRVFNINDTHPVSKQFYDMAAKLGIFVSPYHSEQ